MNHRMVSIQPDINGDITKKRRRTVKMVEPNVQPILTNGFVPVNLGEISGARLDLLGRPWLGFRALGSEQESLSRKGTPL